MGFSDDQQVAMRAEPHPAVLGHTDNFAMLFIAPVSWDVLKLYWTVEDEAVVGPNLIPPQQTKISCFNPLDLAWPIRLL
jgi:hypothetical protein